MRVDVSLHAGVVLPPAARAGRATRWRSRWSSSRPRACCAIRAACPRCGSWPRAASRRCSTTGRRARARAAHGAAPASSTTTCSRRARTSAADGVALVRLEQLYPFPADSRLARVLERYPRTAELVWAQEEPRNMGGLALRARAVPRRRRPGRGRPRAALRRPRPERQPRRRLAQGARLQEQEAIVEEALGTVRRRSRPPLRRRPPRPDAPRPVIRRAACLSA